MSTQRAGRVEVAGSAVLRTGQLWMLQACELSGLRPWQPRLLLHRTDRRCSPPPHVFEHELQAPVRQLASCLRDAELPRRPWQRRRHCRVSSAGREPRQFSLCDKIDAFSILLHDAVRVCSPFTVPELCAGQRAEHLDQLENVHFAVQGAILQVSESVGFACSSQWMLGSETSCPLISLKQLTTRVAVPCPQFAEQTPHSLAAHFACAGQSSSSHCSVLQRGAGSLQ